MLVHTDRRRVQNNLCGNVPHFQIVEQRNPSTFHCPDCTHLSLVLEQVRIFREHPFAATSCY